MLAQFARASGVLVLVFGTSVAMCDSDASSTTSSGTSQSPLKKVATPPAAPHFGGIVFNRMSSNFEAADAPEASSSLGSTAFLSYRLSEKWQAVGVLGFSQEMKDRQRFRLRNTELRGLHQTATLLQGVQLLTGVNTVFPTNLDSRQLEGLRFGVGLANRVKFDLSAHGLPGLSGFYDLNLNRNFHEFDTTVGGQWNTEYMLEHFLLTYYAFSEKLGVMLAGDFTHQWNYGGGVSNSWGFTQELDFAPSKRIQLGLGHTNGGNLLGANGRSLNLKLFNPYESTFYLSLNFVL